MAEFQFQIWGEKNTLNGFVTSYARKQGDNQRLRGHARSKYKQTRANIREESHWQNENN